MTVTCFPAAARHAFAIDDPEAAAALVREFAVWRDSLASYLSHETVAGLSTEITLFLRQAVDPTALPNQNTPYQLQAFPGIDGPNPIETLHQIFYWRAAVVDFLDDAWDTIGPGGLDIDECQTASNLFMPEGRYQAGLSPQCLSSSAPSAKGQHYDLCPVRTYWRN